MTTGVVVDVETIAAEDVVMDDVPPPVKMSGEFILKEANKLAITALFVAESTSVLPAEEEAEANAIGTLKVTKTSAEYFLNRKFAR